MLSNKRQNDLFFADFGVACEVSFESAAHDTQVFELRIIGVQRVVGQLEIDRGKHFLLLSVILEVDFVTFLGRDFFIAKFEEHEKDKLNSSRVSFDKEREVMGEIHFQINLLFLKPTEVELEDFVQLVFQIELAESENKLVLGDAGLVVNLLHEKRHLVVDQSDFTEQHLLRL